MGIPLFISCKYTTIEEIVIFAALVFLKKMNAYNHKKKKLDLRSRPVTMLLFRLLMVVLLFSVSRWLIYIFNTDFFHHLTLWQALRLYVVGIRFDLVVIAYANTPMILYFCLPFKFIYNKVLQSAVSVYYVIINTTIIVLNMMDVIYFRVIGMRMTSELIKNIRHAEESLWEIARQVVADYWFILVLLVLFGLVLVVVSKRTQMSPEQHQGDNRWAFFQWVSLLVFAALTPIAARGGLQEQPINMATAMRYADSQNVPIVLNTPFCIMKTSTDHHLVESHYFDEDEMEFSPIHYSTQAQRFVVDSLEFQPNLVFIILESMGQEMICYYNPGCRYQLTPFLDSLLEQSLTFDGRANGRRSVEAMPSLFSGIPSLMDVDFASSPYADNKVETLETLLKTHGYHTSMSLEDNNDILEPPFATVVYTHSSQHSPTLPKGFELPAESYLWSSFEKTVYYADCALRDFFTEAATKPWFDSTLFVITADHANTEHFLPEYSNIWGMYSIPIAFYMPSRIAPHRCEELAQQIDLNLSIPAALGINDTVFSFGRNVFDTVSSPFCIAYINQTYQYSDGLYLVQSDGDNTVGVFNIRQDPFIVNNIVDHIKCDDLVRKLKECIQEYNHRIINNQLFVYHD